MAELLARALESLENYRTEMRQRYSSDRMALAGLLRRIIAGTVPKRPTAFVASWVHDELILNWDQGRRTPSFRCQVTKVTIPNDPIAFATMHSPVENCS